FAESRRGRPGAESARRCRQNQRGWLIRSEHGHSVRGSCHGKGGPPTSVSLLACPRSADGCEEPKDQPVKRKPEAGPPLLDFLGRLNKIDSRTRRRTSGWRTILGYFACWLSSS